tara:strand:+ start:1826 stop:2872 length:1047 start_codon:yes stop_codon:yes gene_type:complete
MSVKKLSINEKQISLTGFERTYGIGVKNNILFIPDFFSGLIYEFNIENSKSRILYRDKNNLQNLNIFKKLIKSNLKKTIIRPHDIYFDKSMNMYISEMGNKDISKPGKISVFDRNFRLVKDIGIKLHDNYGLINPIMIYKNEEVFYITENGSNKILRFDKDYNFLDWIGFEGDSSEEKIVKNSWKTKKNFIKIKLSNPHAVKVGPDNKIYIVDTGNHRILRFSHDGEYMGWLGKNSNGTINDDWSKEGKSVEGSELGAFNAPCDLIILNNHMYISEVQNNRITKISLDGKNYGWIGEDKKTKQYIWSKELKNKIDLKHPFGIKIENKLIFIADRGNNSVKVIYSKNLF